MVLFRSLLAVTASFVGIILTIPVVVLAFPFWFVASLTRAFCLLFEPRTVGWQQVIEFDPIAGWKPKADLDTWCRFEAGIFHVKTDSDGWAGKARVAESDVVVFGDSFAFGYGVNANAMFSELNPSLRVKAIGAPGYNMVQELLWMRKLSSQLRAKLVIWLICVSNDLHYNLLPNLGNYRAPFVRRKTATRKWEIVTDHVTASRWRLFSENDFRMEDKLVEAFQTGCQSERVYSACEFLISEGKNVCSLVGAQLAVMTIPWMIQLSDRHWRRRLSRVKNPETFDVDLPDKKVGEICEDLGVPFIAGKTYLNVCDYIAQEGHWNESGHRRIARAMADLHHRFMEPSLRLQQRRPAEARRLQGSLP